MGLDEENAAMVPVDAQEKMMNLVVFGVNSEKLVFKMKRSVAFKRLMAAYCKKLELNWESLRFRYKGMPITEFDNPNSIGMEDDDTIEIFQHQMGG